MEIGETVLPLLTHRSGPEHGPVTMRKTKHDHGGETKMNSCAKITRAIEILEAAGHKWTMDLADSVEREVRGADGKDTPTKIARRVAKAIKAAAIAP